MRLLADTHTLLWWLAEDARLSTRAQELLHDERHELLFSAAVAWEISIKCALGKIRVRERYAELLIDEGATPLPVTHEHAMSAGALPLYHRDPFDRMLVAQAQAEDAVLLAADAAFAPYDVRVLW